MSMMRRREAHAVFRRLADELQAGRSAALATVVALTGSGYRRPGARMLVLCDGSRAAGTLSAGCLEEDARLHAVRAMDTGEARLLHYDTSAEDGPGITTGCGGSLDILIEVMTPADAAHAANLAEQLGGRRDVMVIAEGEGVRFTDTLVAPPRLIVCGTGEDAAALADLAGTAGLDVTIAGKRGILPEPLGERDFAVIMTHDFAADRSWLEQLLATRIGYIGLMGPRRRTARLCAFALDDVRIYAPVGFDIGAEGAQQIAIAIVAEVLAVHAGRQPRHLRDRAGPVNEGAGAAAHGLGSHSGDVAAPRATAVRR